MRLSDIVGLKSVENFILESQANLKVAATIAEAWSQARHRLVTQFLTQLEQSVRKKLNGWSFERWGRYFDDSYPGFYIWKPRWKSEYCVNLECGNHGQKMVFGIWRDEQVVNGRTFSEAILSAVKQHFPSARANSGGKRK